MLFLSAWQYLEIINIRRDQWRKRRIGIGRIDVLLHRAVWESALNKKYSGAGGSAIIAKSTNRLLNPNRFCVDKFKKIYLYNWLPGTQISTNYTTSNTTTVLTSIQSYLLKGNRFTLCSGGPRVHGSGSQLSPYRSSLYCQTVKLCSTIGTIAEL